MFRRNRQYLTPDNAPTGTTCWRIFVPDDETYKAALNELLSYLTTSEAWLETVGGISVELASEIYTEQWAKLREDDCMIGLIYPTMAENTPENSLACDGSTHNRIDYPDLYALLDPAFIIDADTFVTPDMRSRVALGAGQASGLSDYAVGELGGFETHTLSIGEMPSHTHTDVPHTHAEGIAVPSAAQVGLGIASVVSVGITGPSSVTINPSGGDGSHNNIQPYIALKWCVIAR